LSGKYYVLILKHLYKLGQSVGRGWASRTRLLPRRATQSKAHSFFHK